MLAESKPYWGLAVDHGSYLRSVVNRSLGSKPAPLPDERPVDQAPSVVDTADPLQGLSAVLWEVRAASVARWSLPGAFLGYVMGLDRVQAHQAASARFDVEFVLMPFSMARHQGEVIG